MGLRRERSDADLLVAALADAEAFGEFYDRHIARVLAFFRRRVPDSELAMDLAAETFAAALASLGNFVPGENLEPIYLRETNFVKAPARRPVASGS